MRPAVLILLPLAACASTPRPDFRSVEPAARNDAIVQAARRRDHAAIPDLVRMLDADDPATRLLAITTLERLTGETLGYDYAAPERDRRRAVQAWAARAAPVPSEPLPRP